MIPLNISPGAGLLLLIAVSAALFLFRWYVDKTNDPFDNF